MSALRRAADDAARAALQRLADDEDLRVDHTNETCFATEEVATPDGISTRLTVADENRFFDVNNLAARNTPVRRTPQDILADILTLCGNFAPSAYVSALSDWMDDNDEGPVESWFYRRQTPPYAAPNRVLYDWTELLAVEGGRRDLFDRRPGAALDAFNADLVDALGVVPAPRERPVALNVNTATREALQGVLGMGQDELLRTILALRALKPIRSLEAIVLAVDPEVAENIRPYLDVRSRYFRVDVRAFANGRAASLRVLAARDAAGRVEILQWVF
jgi:general secretion pathway protein K